MHEKLTAIFEKSSQGYIYYVEELPGANTQGTTLEETKKNLIEAIHFPQGGQNSVVISRCWSSRSDGI